MFHTLISFLIYVGRQSTAVVHRATLVWLHSVEPTADEYNRPTWQQDTKKSPTTAPLL